MPWYLIVYLMVSGTDVSTVVSQHQGPANCHVALKELVIKYPETKGNAFCEATTITRSNSHPSWMTNEQAIKLGAVGLYYGNAPHPDKLRRSR